MTAPAGFWIGGSRYPYYTAALLGAVAIGFVTLGVFVARDLRGVAADTRELNADLSRGLSIIKTLQYDTQEARRAVLYALSTEDANEQLAFAEASRRAGERATRLLAEPSALARTPQGAEAIARIALAWANYLLVRDETIGLILEGSVREGVALDLDEGGRRFQVLQQELDRLGGAFEADAAALARSVDRRTSSTLRRVLLVWLSALAALAAVLFLVSRRLALARLIESEARRNAILEAVLDAVIEVDEGDRVTEFNPAAERLLGWMRNEALGRPLSDLVVGPRQRTQPHSQVAVLADDCEAAPGQVIEAVGCDRGGRQFPVEIRVVRRSVGGEHRFAAHLRDISARRRAEDDLRHAKESAEAASRAKGEFLATMSHEVRTPLNVVLGMTSLMLDSPLTAEQRAWVKAGRASGEALAAVISEILDYSKLDAAQLRLDIQPCNIRSLIEDVLSQAALPAHGRNLEIAYVIEPTVPAVISIDHVRLRQILLNLLSNAVAFTTDGTVNVSVRVAVGPDDSGEVLLELAVSDTGVGISAEDQARLFQPFSQVGRSIAPRRHGIGLGLAISQRLAALLGGSIRVLSAPGSGSVFTVTIRARPVQMHEPTPRLADALQCTRILVIEPKAATRRMIGAQLQASGLSGDTVEIAREALGTLGPGDRYDVAVVGPHAPPSDLAALTEILQVKSSRPSPPVVLLRPSGDPDWLPMIPGSIEIPTPVRAAQLFDAVVLAVRAPARALLGAHEPDTATCQGQDRVLDVLLAEDNDSNRVVIGGMLARLGHMTTVARNGAEAVAAAGQHPYDAVLMDLHMPELDGLEATRRIQKALGPRCPPIIALTATPSPEARQRCAEIGMTGLLEKPFTADTLRSVLRLV